MIAKLAGTSAGEGEVVRHQILIIDDSEDLHPLIIAGLADQELDFHSAYDGEFGVAEAERLLPDLILLDVDMAGADGFEVCRALSRKEKPRRFPSSFSPGRPLPRRNSADLRLGPLTMF